MKIQFELRHPDAKRPTKANETDAGFDMTCVSKKVTPEYIEYDTGVAIKLEKDSVGLLFPRSSISKYNLSLCNSVGVLDYNFGGTITFRFRITEDYPKIYEIGDRIGQIIFLPLPQVELEEVDDIGNTREGYGSTGA